MRTVTPHPSHLPDSVRPGTPGAALDALLEGNRRFVSGRPLHPNQDAARRERGVNEQRPFAIVLGCSDSRLAAEIIFDRGLGDLYVVRTIGHLVGTDVLASIEFGVTALRAPLVVVLGHDNCQAIGSAVTAYDTGVMPHGFLRHIVERLSPEIVTAHTAGITESDAIGRRHVQNTTELLLDRSKPLADAVARKRGAVVGLTYQLDNGRAHVVARHGLDPAPIQERGTAVTTMLSR